MLQLQLSWLAETAPQRTGPAELAARDGGQPQGGGPQRRVALRRRRRGESRWKLSSILREDRQSPAQEITVTAPKVKRANSQVR